MRGLTCAPPAVAAGGRVGGGVCVRRRGRQPRVPAAAHPPQLHVPGEDEPLPQQRLQPGPQHPAGPAAH